MKQTITEAINMKRHQIVVHATLYYRFSTTLWDDAKYDGVVRSLVKLQRLYPEEAAEARWHEEFMEWDDGTPCPSTYSHPIVNSQWAIEKCHQVLRINKERAA